MKVSFNLCDIFALVGIANVFLIIVIIVGMILVLAKCAG